MLEEDSACLERAGAQIKACLGGQKMQWIQSQNQQSIRLEKFKLNLPPNLILIESEIQIRQSIQEDTKNRT